jgi:uncharacterized membrane protein YfcA
MSELQIFASIGIGAAIAAILLIPRASGVAPSSVTSMFSMVFGVLVSSIGFLAFNTDWHEPGALWSGALIAIGALLACHMIRRCTHHDWQHGE